MTRRRPEPPPEPTADERALERELAIAARAAGDALARAVDLAKLAHSQPDGYTIHELADVADTLRGWGLRSAIGAGAMDLMQQWTGRAWTPMDGMDVLRARGHDRGDSGEGREGGDGGR